MAFLQRLQNKDFSSRTTTFISDLRMFHPFQLKVQVLFHWIQADDVGGGVKVVKKLLFFNFLLPVLYI